VFQLTIAADEESVTISDLEIEYEQRVDSVWMSTMVAVRKSPAARVQV
jgi:hypothetical protein